MSALDIIDEFKKEYIKIIEDFSIIDESDPITSMKLSFLQDALQSWIGTLTEIFIKNEKYQNDYEKKNQSNLQKYQQKIRSLNDSFNRNIKNITKDHIEACQKLKQKIELAHKDTDYRIEQYEVEYDYFIATSEQNKIILTNDYAEAKHRFDYQRDEAKESYLEIVKKSNAVLKRIKSQLTSQYDEQLESLLATQTEEVQRLKNYIEIQENELATMTAALEEEKSNMKEKYRQESANLNENIKKIADEKNKLIDSARGEYNKSIAEADVEKEKKRVVYQAQAQALLKEFVTKINIIDENTAALKKEYEKKVNAIKREYYMDVFKKTRIFHSELQQIYTSSPIDKYTNQLIRFKNKQQQYKISITKKEQEMILLELARDNTVKTLSNRNDKNFLEIDKNFAIKNISDQEQYDNKYYQETDNIYENEFNFAVQNANYRFSQQANLLRCQSQIRTKLLERNYDGISANYYKKIESIQNTINTYKVTLDITQKLNQIIIAYLEATHNSKLHLEETNNLLEIEKNKLLKEYNNKQYEYNVNNIALAKKYGFKKIDLENQKAEEGMKLRIQLEKVTLEKNSVSTAYSIKREELNEHFSKIKAQVINNNDLKNAKEDYMTSLIDNDIHYIEMIQVSYTSFLESYSRNYLNMIQIILKDIYPNETNFHYFESLLNKFLELFLFFLKRIVSDGVNNIIDILNNKMNYVYAFKYQSSISSIDDQHNQDVTAIKEKKNEILDKIDSSNKTIENFRQKIFTLINDSEMLIHNTSSNPKKKRYDLNSQALLKQTDLKIKDYKEKIDDYTKMIKMYNDDLDDLNQKLSTRNAEYRNELAKIEKMIREDMQIYTSYKTKLTTFYRKMDEKITDFQTKHFLQSKNPKNLLSQIDSSYKRSLQLICFANSTLTDSFEEFEEDAKKDLSKREAACTLEFKKDVKEFNIKYNKAIEVYQNEYTQAIQKHESSIENQTTLLNQMMQIFDHKLAVAQQDFQNESNSLDAYYSEVRNNFYSSYHALEDNHQNIIAYHHGLRQSKETQYNIALNTLTKDKTTKINHLNEKLKNFIKTKNEEIEHLPIAFKFNSKMLNKETKKKNIELHEALKQLKTNYNLSNRQIEKNIKNFKNQLAQDKYENELNQKRSIVKEKKNNLTNLKQSLKNIHINL